MRTTLTIDDDVLFAAKERARREKRSTGRVLSDLARQSLIRSTPSTTRRQGTAYGFEPLPQRGPAITNSLIDQLREEESE